MIKKITILVAATLAGIALLGGPASAQYEPDPPSATIDDTSVLAGQTVRLTGECHAADTVSLEIEDGPSLGTLPVTDGTFDGSVTIPSDLAPGEYTLLLTCGNRVLSTTITVVASGGGGTTGGDMTGVSDSDDDVLARTGSEVDGLLKAGGGLLVAGAAAVLFATKRRSASA